ncbi:hypothetical protein ACIRD3_37650 [Kitasatospora sp. NPDC093550]|uniref:hypothetical protein n=1 Tax=Kitasatospora sp. NPDC093550 TaxID=3364089 RepID=UPI0038211C82
MIDPYERVHSGEVEMAVANSADAMVKLVLTLATMAAENAARARRERWEREREAAAEKHWRERAAAEPWLRAPYDERFWDELEPTPEGMRPLGQAWQTAYEWGGSDPQAAAALHHMRARIQEKFGLLVPDEMLPVQDLSRAIALSDPNLHERARAGREEAAEIGQTSYLYVIEDPASDTQLATGEVRGHDWEAPDLVAAHAHEQWAAGSDAPLGDGVVIRVYENTGGPVGGRDPLAVVEARRVPELLDAERERQRRVVAGTQEAGAAEVLHAVGAEHRRAGERADRWQEARDRLADTDPAELPEGEHARQVDALQREVVRERLHQARLSLHGQAVAAEQRGEDPDLVYAGAALRARLDQGWMAEASPAEAAGVWSEVNGWQPGAARDQALDAVNGQLVNHYGIELHGDVDRAEAARALESMADVEDRGEPDHVRRQALELHRRALEKNEQALRNEDRIAQIKSGPPPLTPEAAARQEARIDGLAKGADQLRASADIDSRAAVVVEAQADRLAASDSSDPSALPPGVTREQVAEAHQSAWGDDPVWAGYSTTPPTAGTAAGAGSAPPAPEGPATPAPAPAPAPAQAAPVGPAQARAASAPGRRRGSQKALEAKAGRATPKLSPQARNALGPTSKEARSRIDQSFGRTPAASPAPPGPAAPGAHRGTAKGKGNGLG